MSIVLIRHGETLGNAERRLQFPETPLSDRGLAQAERLGARFAEHPVGAIVSSDYARARMTAEAVQRVTGAPLQLEPDLRERNFGDLRGTAYADLDFDPFAPGYTPPNGESWEDLHARADRAWETLVALAARVENDLVAVSHGLVCYSLASRKLALPHGEDAPSGFGNTAVTVIDPAPPHLADPINCTEHLDAATAHDPRTRSGL